jgi:hypothetical protein
MLVLRASATLFLLFSLTAGPVLAWTPETRVRMADEAIKFMPHSLRLALEKERRSVMRGVLEPMVQEDAPEHQAPWLDGTLDQQLESEAKALIAALGRQTPFDQISERFGRLGHFVMDAAFPPGVGEDGGGRYADFAAYCELKLDKFPLVFYGHDDEALAGGEFGRFALRVMENARAEDGELSRAYARAGDTPGFEAFDDRSIPFAVGSLSYSHCVTDIVRSWLAVWRLAGGDMGRTPYLEPATEPSTSGGP